MSSSTGKLGMQKDEPAQTAPSALEHCTVENSAGVFCEGTAALKGLPADHWHDDCMGEYVK
jgi:hypothetical protein